MPAQLTEMCENCTPKECPKTDWKARKPYCLLIVEMAQRADYSDRPKAIGEWCDAFSLPIGAVSASALDIMTHPEHIVIYLGFLGPTAKPPRTHPITSASASASASASVLPLAPLGLRAPPSPNPSRAQRRAAAGHDPRFAPRPRLSWSYTTPFVVPRDIARWRQDAPWLEHLRKARREGAEEGWIGRRRMRLAQRLALGSSRLFQVSYLSGAVLPPNLISSQLHLCSPPRLHGIASPNLVSPHHGCGLSSCIPRIENAVQSTQSASPSSRRHGLARSLSPWIPSPPRHYATPISNSRVVRACAYFPTPPPAVRAPDYPSCRDCHRS
ncbi:hypothetical protein DFH09DRAFT_1362437 [Mycena vulgaris]|nr:hypothetical protein DFH09DRAFT_1362437 [Mycena vulgaris]